MKTKVLFVERKPSASVSIEKVFRQIAKNLSKEDFVVSFEQLPFSNNFLGTFKNLLLYRKTKSDIYHITGHIHYIALLLPKKNTVLTIHDAGILHIRKGLRRYILKKLLFDYPVKKMRFITVVSEATKKEIIYYTNCDEKKIRVIENPLQEHFRASSKKTFNPECPKILQIGTTANKNLENLIFALEGTNCRLRIIGQLRREIINLLEKKKIIYENTQNLDNSEMKNEYEAADLVAFCSTFEGFGLPVIEAQAMLTPVITSAISPLKEVAGKGAAFADPTDYLSIRNGIRQIINDEIYREKLVRLGLENVKRFDSKKIADRYANLYQEIHGAADNPQMLKTDADRN